MSKHTPGPWEIFEFLEDGPDKQPGIVAAGSREDIVIWGEEGDESGIHGETPEQALANARLIAAAPELLAFALAYREAFAKWEISNSFSNVFDTSGELSAKAGAAIAKATQA